jgi:FtsH-binding integral membrane protein
MKLLTIPNQAIDEQTLDSTPVVAPGQARAVFGQAMGLTALTVGFAALGAYLGRNLSGGLGIALFVAALVCVVGLDIAARRGHEQLAISLLFGLGLALGLAVAPVLARYAETQPAVLWQASGVTGAFIAALGAYGYATRRDLSNWARTLFWALLGLIALGIVGLLVAVPGGNVIYCAIGLVVFGGFTIFDFNRLRNADMVSAIPIAASIFLDVFNVFLLLLDLFSVSEG